MPPSSIRMSTAATIQMPAGRPPEPAERPAERPSAPLDLRKPGQIDLRKPGQLDQKQLLALSISQLTERVNAAKIRADEATQGAFDASAAYAKAADSPQAKINYDIAMAEAKAAGDAYWELERMHELRSRATLK